LVVLEALRCGYGWASDRLHAFVIQGMADNQARFSYRNVLYYPYLEPEPGAGRGLLAELARHACVIVSDDFPSFFLPRMIPSAAAQVSTRLELVDSNGLLPMRAADRTFARAFDFRRFLQGNLQPHLESDARPQEDPLQDCRLPVMEDLRSRGAGPQPSRPKLSLGWTSWIDSRSITPFLRLRPQVDRSRQSGRYGPSWNRN
jgi:deoxyribodipyrimidine photo-lyase